MAIDRRELNRRAREESRKSGQSPELKRAVQEQRKAFEQNTSDVLGLISNLERDLIRYSKDRIAYEKEINRLTDERQDLIDSGLDPADSAVASLTTRIESFKSTLSSINDSAREAESAVENSIQKLGKNDLFKLIEKREESISKMIENRSKAEVKLDNLSREYDRRIAAGESESSAAMIELDNQIKHLEDALVFIDSSIERSQEDIDKGMERLKKGATTFWDDWSDAERRAFTQRFDNLELASEQINDTLDKIHGRIADDLNDLEQELNKTLSESLNDFANEMREWADTFSLQAISSSLGEEMDNFIKNRREMLAFAGSSFDIDGFASASNSLVHELNSYSRDEASDFYSEFMRTNAIKDMEEAQSYVPEIAAAVKGMGTAIDSYSSILWRDEDGDNQGQLVRLVNNMAATMEENKELYVTSADLVAKVNDNINTITAFTGKDFKRNKGLIKSVMAIESLQQSVADSGMDTMAEALAEWQLKSAPELNNDERFLQFASFLGINGETFHEAALAGDTEQISNWIIQFQDMMKDISAGPNGDYNLYGFNEGYGLFGSVADARAFMNVDPNEIAKAMSASGLSGDIGFELTESGFSKAEEKENNTVGAVEAFQNETTTWFTVITDRLAELNITASSMSSFLAKGSALVGGASKLIDLFGGPGTFGNFMSHVPGIGKIFTNAGSAGGGAGSAGGILGNIRNLFNGGAGTGSGAGGAGVPSGIRTAFSTGLGKIGGFMGSSAGFGGTTATSFAGTLGSVLSVAGPVAGGLMALSDAYNGVEKSVEWLGDEGSTGVGQLSSGLAAAVGGTSSGLSGALGGAAKGALIGAIGGPVGMAIGGAIGGALGAIGGEKIAGFLDTTFHAIGDAGSAMFDSLGEGVLDMNAMLQKMGPLGETLGTTLVDSFNAIDSTRHRLEDIWADPNTGLAAKLGGSIGELFSGTGKLATSLLKGGLDLAKKSWDGVSGIAKAAWSGISSVVGQAWNSMLDGIDAIANAAGGFAKDLGSAGATLFSGIGDGISSVISSGGDLLSGFGNFLFGGSSSLEISNTLENSTGDPVLDRLDTLIAYTKYIAENRSSGGLVSSVISSASSLFGFSSNNENLLTNEVNVGGYNLYSLVSDLYDLILSHYQDEENYNKEMAVQMRMSGVGLGSGYGRFGQGSTLNTLLGDTLGMSDVAIANAFASGSTSTSAGGGTSLVASAGRAIRGVASKIGNFFGFPSYQQGTSFVPNDQLALLHEGEAVVPASIVSGNDVASHVWNWFSGKGFTSQSIAGILGNFQAESAMFPARVQNDYSSGYQDSIAYTEKVDSGLISRNDFVWHGPGGGGYGLPQFTYYTYKEGLYDRAKQRGTSISDIDTQLLTMYELGNYGSYKGMNNVQSASNWILHNFEKPEGHDSFNKLSYESIRGSLSMDWFKNLGGVASYDVGTPWVSGDQIAYIHDGEMIVPSSLNPIGDIANTYELDMGLNSGKGDDSGSNTKEVVDAMRWQVKRLEDKLDKVIDAVNNSNKSTRPQKQAITASTVNRLLSPTRTL